MDMSAYEFDVCKLGASHHTECWSSASYLEKGGVVEMRQQSLCVVFASFVVMTHQRDITSVDADTVEWIKDIHFVCVCVYTQQDN